MTFKYDRSSDHVKSRKLNLFLEKIPEPVYREMAETFKSEYGFKNGDQMFLADYFLGISKDLADVFMKFIQRVVKETSLKKFPFPVVPEGFSPASETLLPHELNNGFSFACFDAAITEDGIKIIEFQAFPTNSVPSARMSFFIREKLPLPGSFVFPNDPDADWNDFISLKRKIIAGDKKKGIILTDRNIESQKTYFNFRAIQRELDAAIDLVDASRIFERDGGLFYKTDHGTKQARRLYNRVVPAEAALEDDYPRNSDAWNFRFDQAYEKMVFVNHPCKYFEISKGLLPHIKDPINPLCYELADAADQFRSGELPFSEFVFKDAWGFSGHRNTLLPNIGVLDQLTGKNMLGRYIAQQKIPFELFRTGDNLEKIVELRFMTMHSGKNFLTTPMARIGHIHQTREGEIIYKIHFSDNNMPGYGYCPVVIFE